MRVYVFLKSGGVDPFGNVAWVSPTADGSPTWVSSPHGMVAGYRIDDLPYWVSDELWEAELDDPVQVLSKRLLAPRARLIARLHWWTADACAAFVEGAVRHSCDLVADAVGHDIAAQMRALRTLDEMAALSKFVVGNTVVDPHAGDAAVRLVGEAATDLGLGTPGLALHEAAMAVGMVAAGGLLGDPAVFEEAMGSERQWQADHLRARFGALWPVS